MKQVTMTEAEYERFCEFRGAEKTIQAIRGQTKLQVMKYEELAQAVDEAFDIRIDGSEVIVLDQEKAAYALRLAAEMQG